MRSALQADADAFNAWNGIGYAYLEKGDVVMAIDAFDNAIHANMAGKADFCDLAYAQLKAGNEELALKYCRRAMAIDASARTDLLADERFAAIHKFL